MSQRRKFGAEFKAKVSLEAMREQQTLAAIATKYKLHQNQVSAWKKEAMESMTTIFHDKRSKDTSIKEAEEQINELQRMVGQLTMERNWLKKKSIQLGL